MIGFFCAMCLPLFQEVIDASCTQIEVFRGKNSLKINKINRKINNIQADIGDKENINAVGFQCAPPQKMEEEEDERT
jgi:hypothetical protein